MRAPVVFYNRCNEAAGQLKPGDFNWKAIFGQGVRWFHSGGIFAALSETTGELIIEAMKAAKAAGAVTSFDLNYRQKLWDIWGGHDQGRRSAGAASSKNVDVLVGNEEDLQKGLGIEGQDVESQVEARSERVLRGDRKGREEIPERQSRRDHAAGSAFHQPPHLGRGRLDRTARPTSRRCANWTSSTASAAATVMRRDFSTAC